MQFFSSIRKNITDKMELNAEIKAFLVTNDVCQEAVAADIGTSQSSFSKFLNHGRGLNSGKRRALYTWYLEQKQTNHGFTQFIISARLSIQLFWTSKRLNTFSANFVAIRLVKQKTSRKST